jgi:hypothetical protein
LWNRHQHDPETLENFTFADRLAQFNITRSSIHLVNDDYEKYDEEGLGFSVKSLAGGFPPLKIQHHPVVHLLFAFLDSVGIRQADRISSLFRFSAQCHRMFSDRATCGELRMFSSHIRPIVLILLIHDAIYTALDGDRCDLLVSSAACTTDDNDFRVVDAGRESMPRSRRVSPRHRFE